LSIEGWDNLKIRKNLSDIQYLGLSNHTFLYPLWHLRSCPLLLMFFPLQAAELLTDTVDQLKTDHKETMRRITDEHESSVKTINENHSTEIIQLKEINDSTKGKHLYPKVLYGTDLAQVTGFSYSKQWLRF